MKATYLNAGGAYICCEFMISLLLEMPLHLRIPNPETYREMYSSPQNRS